LIIQKWSATGNVEDYKRGGETFKFEENEIDEIKEVLDKNTFSRTT
jgi:hypothetical protein